MPAEVAETWTTRLHRRATLAEGLKAIIEKHPKIGQGNGARAPRHARHRQPLHRGLPRRERPGVGDAALGLARHRQPHRHLLHRARQARGGALVHPAARSRPRLPAGGHRAVLGLRAGGRLGAGVRARQPRADDGPRPGRAAAELHRLRAWARWRSTATTTTSRPSSTSAPRCGSPARARCAPARASSASSPARWAPSRSSSAARAIPSRSTPARTAPAGR